MDWDSEEDEDETDDRNEDELDPLYAAPLLTPAEERALFIEYARTHDKVIRDRILLANTRWVRTLATRYVAGRERLMGSLTLDDFISEGMFGLMKAIERYDLAYGVAFSTYATNWIFQAMQRARGDKAQIIREPIHVQTARAKARRAGQPFRDEIRVNSLDMPHDSAHRESSAPLGETLPDLAAGEMAERVIEREYWRETLYVALAKLPDREKLVIALRYGLDNGDNGDERESDVAAGSGGAGRTLEMCGALLGISRERIRQIEVDALTHLRLMLRETADGDAALRMLALIKSKRIAPGRAQSPARQPSMPERRRERAREAQRRYRERKQAEKLAS